jgi:hypothetical protein
MTHDPMIQKMLNYVSTELCFHYLLLSTIDILHQLLNVHHL